MALLHLSTGSHELIITRSATQERKQKPGAICTESMGVWVGSHDNGETLNSADPSYDKWPARASVYPHLHAFILGQEQAQALGQLLTTPPDSHSEQSMQCNNGLCGQHCTVPFIMADTDRPNYARIEILWRGWEDRQRERESRERKRKILLDMLRS